MAGDDICDNIISVGFSIVAGSLLLISELLGSRKNKESKCTSVLQFVSAIFVWIYLRFFRGSRSSDPEKLGEPGEPVLPEEEVTHFEEAAATVSRSVTIKMPKWRQSAASLQ